MNLTDQYRQMHEAGHFAGLSTLDWADDIGAMLKEHDCKTVLDYGCGKGRQYEPPHELHKRWGVEKPTLYDPGVLGIDELPSGPFDAVICSDVLEHLRSRSLLDAITNCLQRADKAVFFSICCRPAKKLLPSGENCHLTIQPPTWWRGFIEAALHSLPMPPRSVLKIVLKFET